jgi:hypothetical protein
MSAGGVLFVAADESAAALTVRATSTVDTTKSGTATITVISGETIGPPTLGELSTALDGLPTNTAANPHIVKLDSSVVIDTSDTNANGVWATINSTVQAARKYVILDISACTAVNNTIERPFSDPIIIQHNAYIKGVTLPSTLTSIGYSAFAYCSGLTSVTIPGSVTSIGEWAFAYCGGLTSVIIPGSVTSIEGGAFYNCIGLTSVIFGAGSNITTAWRNHSFSDNNDGDSGDSGNSLWTAYTAGTKVGTYTRNGAIWTQES